MPVSGALRRLLRVRDLEEEQERLALESALADLHALERTLLQLRGRERRARQLLVSSAGTADLTDRFAAQVQREYSARQSAALVPRIVAAKREADHLRNQYLDKRIERRQAETLISTIEKQDSVIAERRAQQEIDDWFAARVHRTPADANDMSRPRRKKL